MIKGGVPMYFNNDVRGLRRCGCDRKEHDRNDHVEVNPTETVVNTRTKKRVVKNIHPTEVINVNRTVIRNEHFYPVTEREVNETVVEDYDCGSDVNNPRCRRRGSDHNNNGCHHHHHCNCRKR